MLFGPVLIGHGPVQIPSHGIGDHCFRALWVIKCKRLTIPGIGKEPSYIAGGNANGTTNLENSKVGFLSGFSCCCSCLCLFFCFYF